MSSTWKSRPVVWFFAITIAFICLGAIAYTLVTAQQRPLPQAQAECAKSSKDAKCLGKRNTPSSLQLDRLVPIANGSELGGYLNDTPHDHLSDSDQLFYKSRNSDFWKASNQDTLRQVLFVHRHGDRTPVDFFPHDELVKEPFWRLHGFGQLTNRGKSRLYMLGKIIRQRYDAFLNGSVNKNLVKSRASGSLRCIESAQVFLSSFLSLDTDVSSQDVRALVWDEPRVRLAQIWQPASIQTLAAKHDGLLNEGAGCKILHDEYDRLDMTEERSRLVREFKYEAGVLKSELGFDVEHFNDWVSGDSQLEVVRSYFVAKMKPTVLAISGRLKEASDRALVLQQSSFKIRRARTGLLINDIIENMDEMRAGSQSTFTKKFVHYTGHDVTILYLVGALYNIEKYPHRPDYASNIAFELHQDKDEWFVRFFYMQHVPSKPHELHIDACESGHPKGRCTLDRFETLMQKYRIASWMDWMKECGNSLDSFDPYDQNT